MLADMFTIITTETMMVDGAGRQSHLTHAAAPLELQVWLSSSFPVGSFAFSHGLEWAVHAGDIGDVRTAAAWIGGLLALGSLRNDAILAACALRATADRDKAALLAARDLAVAMAGSRERHLETTMQGEAFMSAIRAAWMTPGLDWAVSVLPDEVPYPVAVGAVAASHGLPLATTVEMLAAAQVQSLASALIRLSVIGQTDGQHLIAALIAPVRALAREAAQLGLDDIATCTLRSEIAAMRHETQTTRLFRS